MNQRNDEGASLTIVRVLAPIFFLISTCTASSKAISMTMASFSQGLSMTISLLSRAIVVLQLEEGEMV